MLLLDTKILALLSALSLGSCLSTGVSPPNRLQSPTIGVPIAGTPMDWSPATFNGLIIGKSSRHELIRKLGTPLSSYESTIDLREGGVPELNDEFIYSAGFKGKMVASSSKDTGVLTSLTIYPDDLSFARLLEIYGTDFVRTRYRIVECERDQGSSVMEEHRDGEIEFVEFRAQGIVVDVAKNSVREIIFVGQPVGVVDYLCPK